MAKRRRGNGESRPKGTRNVCSWQQSAPDLERRRGALLNGQRSVSAPVTAAIKSAVTYGPISITRADAAELPAATRPQQPGAERRPPVSAHCALLKAPTGSWRRQKPWPQLRAFPHERSELPLCLSARFATPMPPLVHELLRKKRCNPLPATSKRDVSHRDAAIVRFLGAFGARDQRYENFFNDLVNSSWPIRAHARESVVEYIHFCACVCARLYLFLFFRILSLSPDLPDPSTVIRLKLQAAARVDIFSMTKGSSLPPDGTSTDSRKGLRTE